MTDAVFVLWSFVVGFVGSFEKDIHAPTEQNRVRLLYGLEKCSKKDPRSFISVDLLIRTCLQPGKVLSNNTLSSLSAPSPVPVSYSNSMISPRFNTPTPEH